MMTGQPEVTTDHPFIVNCYDCGSSDGPFEMELVIQSNLTIARCRPCALTRIWVLNRVVPGSTWNDIERSIDSWPDSLFAERGWNRTDFRASMRNLFEEFTSYGGWDLPVPEYLNAPEGGTDE